MVDRFAACLLKLSLLAYVMLKLHGAALFLLMARSPNPAVHQLLKSHVLDRKQL
jgi:hypothetical protein